MPTDRMAERLTRCVVGLACFGVGIALLITAHLGLAPWDVLHQGISKHTGIAIGWVIEGIGAAVLVVSWLLLRQRPGIGTILNVLEIGLVVNLVNGVIPATDRLVSRLVYMVTGIVMMGIASGLYIGAGLGAGPRDGLMIGIAERTRLSLRVARTVIEVVVLVGGVLLGGKVGLGTVAFTLGIGPLVHVLIPRLVMREPRTVAAAQ